jgi:hypothetical protein
MTGGVPPAAHDQIQLAAVVEMAVVNHAGINPELRPSSPSSLIRCLNEDMVYVVTGTDRERNRPPQTNWGYEENSRKYICSLGGHSGFSITGGISSWSRSFSRLG